MLQRSHDATCLLPLGRRSWRQLGTSVLLLIVQTFWIALVIIVLILLVLFINLFIHILIARPEVELECNAVVTDGQVQLTDAVIATSPVEIRIRILRIYFNNSTEIFHGFFVPRQPLIRDATIMQCVNVCLVLLYHRCVINNGLLVSAEFGEAVGTIVERLNIIRPT
jgi:hypothetical protein